MPETLETQTQQSANELLRVNHTELPSHLGGLASPLTIEVLPVIDAEPDPTFMGVHATANGELDYSHAAVVSLPPKSVESEVSQATAIYEIPTIETVLSDAEKVNIDGSKLRQISQMLHMLDKPHEQMSALKRIVKRDGIGLTADELLKLTRNYQREVIKSSEEGDLLHYHQTYLSNLESILDNGGLLSTDEQRQLGFTIQSAGSRPDVVQMTRDKYDADGNLVDAGIKGTSSGLGAAGEIAFVIDESIMDDPDYDSIVNFPNAPHIPLGQMKAVLVSDEAQISFVQNLLSRRGINKEVILRKEWLRNYSPLLS